MHGRWLPDHCGHCDRPCGLMDKALVLGTKDSRFECCQGHFRNVRVTQARNGLASGAVHLFTLFVAVLLQVLSGPSPPPRLGLVRVGLIDQLVRAYG